MNAKCAAVIRYIRRWPAKRLAHGAVRRALANGSLRKQPCEVCGEPDSVAHHDDYLKQRDVRWLCDEHHRQWHRANGPGKNGDAPGPAHKAEPADRGPKLGTAGAALVRFLCVTHGNSKKSVARWFGVDPRTVRDVINGRSHRT